MKEGRGCLGTCTCIAVENIGGPVTVCDLVFSLKAADSVVDLLQVGSLVDSLLELHNVGIFDRGARSAKKFKRGGISHLLFVNREISVGWQS